MNSTFCERRGDEVYVYVRGVLIMKRWLKTGVSALFDAVRVRWSYPSRPG